MNDAYNHDNQSTNEITAEDVGTFLDTLRDQSFVDTTRFLHLKLIQTYLDFNNEPSQIDLRIACKHMFKDVNDKLTLLMPQLGQIVAVRYFSDKRRKDRQIYKEMGLTERTYYRFINDAKVQLADMINEEERRSQVEHRLNLSNSIGGAPPATYVGSRRSLERFVNDLKDPEGSKIIVLTGMGGIGKTTLAEKGLKESLLAMPLDDFYRIDIANGVFRREKFFESLYSQLIGKENEKPSREQVEQVVSGRLMRSLGLVFVDGIEFELAGLLSIIQSLNLSQTRFVVTSREEPSLPGTKINHIRLNTLSLEESKFLMKEDGAKISDQYGITPFGEDEMDRIYAAIGGHPLALKLVVGLLTELSKAEIFADLSQLTHPDTYEMYARVYQKVWGALGQNSQWVLMGLTMIEDLLLNRSNLKWMLGNLEFDMSDSDLLYATNELKSRSMIEIRPGLEGTDTQYGIHNLTRYFVKEDVYSKFE